MLRRTVFSLLYASLSKGQLLSVPVRRSPFCPLNQETKSCSMHVKARCAAYPVRRDEERLGDVKRTPVPDEKVPWSVDWEEYSPLEFTAKHVLTASWADPELNAPGFEPKWNCLDGQVNRTSQEPGDYIVTEGRPLNPHGRTGIKGRGVLGRWGPNHAADPIVTRWRREENGEISTDPASGQRILEFVSIERKDGGGWAIPGGMVDPGEKVSVTLKREFMEEAMDSTTATSDENEANAAMVDQFFGNGEEVYKGYVDDPRNTDNAWMETVAVNFHDESGESVGKMQLKAGDDAKSLQWKEMNSGLSLYASHKDFIERVARLHGAHW